METVYRSKAEAEAGQIEEDWGRLIWLASDELTGSDTTLGRVTIKQGTSNPRHVHPTSTEVLYLLSGALEHHIAGETIRQEAGDTVILPAGVAHIAHSVGRCDADMIVAYPTGQRKFQVVPPASSHAEGKEREDRA